MSEVREALPPPPPTSETEFPPLVDGTKWRRRELSSESQRHVSNEPDFN